MKKVLILEDSEERIQQFRKNFINAELTIVQIPQEAIELLKNNEYFAIFLDHDLGGTVYAPSDANSGYAVAKWLEENPSRMPEHTFIHSLNAAGQKSMKQALPKAHIVPFAWANQANFAKVI